MKKCLHWLLLATLMIPGASNAETTTEVICSYAPSQNAIVNRITAELSGAGMGAVVALKLDDSKIVLHSSGRPIMHRAGGYVAGSMRGALVTTTLIKVGVVVGVAVIIVELVCAPTNHPELVKQVIDDASVYWTMSKDGYKEVLDSKAMTKTSDWIRNFRYFTEDKYHELIGEPWYQGAFRKTKRAFGG